MSQSRITDHSNGRGSPHYPFSPEAQNISVMESKGSVRLQRSLSDTIKDPRLLKMCSTPHGLLDLFSSFLIVTNQGKLLRISGESGTVDHVFDREYKRLNEFKLFTNNSALILYDSNCLDVIDTAHCSFKASFDNVRSLTSEDTHLTIEFESGVFKKYDQELSVISLDAPLKSNEALLKHYSSVLAALRESKFLKDKLMKQMAESYDKLLFESHLFSIFGQINKNKSVQTIASSQSKIALRGTYQSADSLIYMFEICAKNTSHISIDAFPPVDFRVLLLELHKDVSGVVIRQVNVCNSVIYCALNIPLSAPHLTEFRFNYLENESEWCAQSIESNRKNTQPLMTNSDVFSTERLVALLSTLREEHIFICQSSFSDLRVLVPDILESLGFHFLADWHFFLSQDHRLLICFHAKMENHAIIKVFSLQSEELVKAFVSEFYSRCPEDILLEATGLEPADFSKFNSVMSEEISFIESSLNKRGSVTSISKEEENDAPRYETRKRKLNSIYADNTSLTEMEYNKFLSKLLLYESKTNLMIV
eukprot:TRINITY_DN5366_c0_g1_i1.p1 TRINITY_DN5366_c0_g1~~TRINITY_DN5366_c0_g1_i1.p1  ORF type:complete len:536 (-),score=56.48 TRINITY_DN5366_c0_g1_i1:1061-2668(-)